MLMQYKYCDWMILIVIMKNQKLTLQQAPHNLGLAGFSLTCF